MKQKFIPWPDYAVCTKCKAKVDVPKERNIFNKQPETKTILCPTCGTKIEYLVHSNILGPKHSI